MWFLTANLARLAGTLLAWLLRSLLGALVLVAGSSRHYRVRSVMIIERRLERQDCREKHRSTVVDKRMCVVGVRAVTCECAIERVFRQLACGAQGHPQTDDVTHSKQGRGAAEVGKGFHCDKLPAVTARLVHARKLTLRQSCFESPIRQLRQSPSALPQE